MAAQVQGSEPDKSIREVRLADAMIGLVLRAKEEDKPPTAELYYCKQPPRQLVQPWDQFTMEYCIVTLNLMIAQSTLYR